MNLRKGLAYLTIVGTILSSCGKKNIEDKFKGRESPKTEMIQDTSKSYINSEKVVEYKYGESELLKNWKVYRELGFNMDEEIAYDILDGNRFIAKKYAEKGQTPRESVLNLALNIKPEDVGKFNDSEKPNALIIYSKYDHNNAFVMKPNLEILKRIGENYDVSLSVCGNDTEVERALDKVANPDLIIFGGHGTGYAIELNDSIELDRDAKFNRGLGSKYAFDARDNTIIEKLSEKGNAVCIMENCLNGIAFAPYIKSKAPNLKVFAAKKIIGIKDIEVNSVYLFGVSFYDEDGRDCTYKE